MECIAVQIKGIGRRNLAINTSSLEDKKNACNMLYQFVLDLEGCFFPYAQNVANILIPLMVFGYSEDIRMVSSMTIPLLVLCSIDASEHAFNEQAIQQAGGASRVRQVMFDAGFGPLFQVPLQMYMFFY